MNETDITKTLQPIMCCRNDHYIAKFFRCVENVEDVAFRSSGGRAFQIAGPATVNVPSAFLTIRYDTKNSLTWTQKLSDQLNLAHVAKKYE